jgi:Arc/MetJ family transcription regulator
MQGVQLMATNLAIDDRLIDEARRIGNHKTKKEAVTTALREYIDYRRQLKILELAGTIDYDPTYDYKKVRRLDRIAVEP